jgi:hypothetical protein
MVRPEYPVIDTCVTSNYLYKILFGDNDDAHIQPETRDQLVQATQAGQVRQAVFILDLD